MNIGMAFCSRTQRRRDGFVALQRTDSNASGGTVNAQTIALNGTSRPRR
jgi:hypothetical protein